MILIGTHHEDILGPNRLDLILNELKPKVISIEIPFNTYTFNTQDLELYFNELKSINFQAIKEANISDISKKYFKTIAAAKYYEFFIPLNYSKNNSAEIHFVDHPDALINLDDLRVSDFRHNYEVMAKHNNFDGLTFEKIMNYYIKIVDKVYSDPEIMMKIESSLEKVKEELIGLDSKSFKSISSFANEREEYMSQMLLQINPDVHIGGILHMNPELKSIFPVEKPLYEQVASITEKVIKLCDVKLA